MWNSCHNNILPWGRRQAIQEGCLASGVINVNLMQRLYYNFYCCRKIQHDQAELLTHSFIWIHDAPMPFIPCQSFFMEIITSLQLLMYKAYNISPNKSLLLMYHFGQL